MNHNLTNFIKSIAKAIYNDYYIELAETNLIQFINNEKIIKIDVKPNDGFHKNKNYILTIKFRSANEWPLIYIDSEIYDKIKTTRYLENRGRFGEHKGICIKNLSNGYNFKKNFNEICNNKWENYIYYLILFFNNIEDIEKGIGIKHNYKYILSIN